MALFDQPISTDEKEYRFASGSSFLEELKRQKQDTGVSEDDGLDDLPPFEEEQDEQEQRTLQESKSVSRVAGEQLTLLTDTILPVLLAIMLKDDPDVYRATDNEKKMLDEAFASYTQMQGINMPPWLVLVGTVLSIYGFKAYHGYKFKKQEDENAKLKKRIEELENGKQNS